MCGGGVWLSASKCFHDEYTKAPSTVRRLSGSLLNEYLNPERYACKTECLTFEYWYNKAWEMISLIFNIIEPRHKVSNNVVCATSKRSDQPAHTRSLIRAFVRRLNILWQLSYWLNIILGFYTWKEAAQVHLSLHLSKYHIVGNHMSRLNYYYTRNYLGILVKCPFWCNICSYVREENLRVLTSKSARKIWNTCWHAQYASSGIGISTDRN